MRRLFLLLLLLVAWPAAAQTGSTQIGPTQAGAAQAEAANERSFGHLPYAETDAAALVLAPAGFAIGQPCRLQPAVLPDLQRLVAAEAASGVSGRLHGVSCFRSIAHQQAVFCRKGRGCRDPASRARQVAPPGHSEHETGYAIDFAVRPAPGCPDTSDCIARTPAGQWLLANGPRFGFELSFPSGNSQGVTWEPWHWRWVGTNGDLPEAARARAVFAAARSTYPASPAVPPLAIRVAEQPPIPISAIVIARQPPLVRLPRDKRR